MNTALLSCLAELGIGEPSICNNLAMVPLFRKANIEPNYIILDEGLTSSLFEIEELDGGASVSNILFRNKAGEQALLFEGEEFLGAMQNRILNVTVLVSPKTEQKLPVSCVEAGRWHHEHADRKKQRFTVANRMHYARGRALGNRAVSMNLASSNEYRSDQSGIWSDIDEKSSRMNARSPSAASDALYVSSEDRINEYVKSFKHHPKQVGSVFLIDGHVTGMELFASESTHNKVINKLLRSYALDAVDSALPQSDKVTSDSDMNAQDQCIHAVNEFNDQLKSAWTKEFQGVCEGINVRFKDERLTGGALLYEDQILHFCAFAIPEELTFPRRPHRSYSPV
ncbi:MAG: hypothetical protein OXG08_08155 [Gammaproteobacteria bacterium]|nr:hypothetical protein [Gammaproteobacteria bacterium]